MKILIINGPNLNLLGTREPEIYGNQSFEDYFSHLQFQLKDVELSYFQSNHEGNLIDKLQESGAHFDGVILNAAAYTHTSIAIADTVKAIDVPVIEVHISNVQARGTHRKQSYIAPFVKGIVAGFGLKSYELAVRSFLDNE